MTVEATGLVYMVQPSLQDIQEGVVLFDPSQHSQLWAYVIIDGNTFTNQPDLVDWDLNIMEWDENSMGVWPFGTPIPDEVKELRGSLASLEELDSFLEDELFIMDQEEAAAQVDDDDDDDDSDDDEESEDEGYMINEDHGNDQEDDYINLCLAPMLMNILL